MEETKNMKKLVYICSPCRGDYERNIIKAQEYCKEAMELWDVIPVAPHVYFTQFLNDRVKAEREAGMDAGLELLNHCSELWVYGMENPSEGMKREILYAQEHGIPVIDAVDIYDRYRRPTRTTFELMGGAEHEL